MHPLALHHCSPQTAPLPAADLGRELATLGGWQLASVDGVDAIEKTFRFGDFHHTMAFVNAVAYVAHAEDHHPDLSVGYAHCTVRYSTHSAGGVTLNDLICAARIDALQA